MCMINKIGTKLVTLESKPINFEMIDHITKKRPPLTPDLFPYYAGTWEDDYEDYLDYDNTQDYEIMDYDEIYRDELEALNHPQIEDLNKISAIVEEVQVESSAVESFKDDPIYDELTKKLDAIDNQINDIHAQKFNDIKIDNKKEVDAKPTVSVTERIEDPTNSKYSPKFVVKANEKNNYYEDVLEIVNSVFNESK